jgi:DNA ligase (NAD+)
LNIEGLSTETLFRFLKECFLKKYSDIFHLDEYRDQITEMDGFGDKSWNNLWDAIQKARTVSLSKYINALSIPMVGKGAAKLISSYCNGSFETFNKYFQDKQFDWTAIDGIGEITRQSINNFDDILTEGLADELNIVPDPTSNDNTLSGKVFCVTGKLENYTRESIIEAIENRGGKVASSVSAKTDYLITNTPDSNSSKNKKAKELGIKVITEKEFSEM